MDFWGSKSGASGKFPDGWSYEMSESELSRAFKSDLINLVSNCSSNSSWFLMVPIFPHQFSHLFVPQITIFPRISTQSHHKISTYFPQDPWRFSTCFHFFPSRSIKIPLSGRQVSRSEIPRIVPELQQTAALTDGGSRPGFRTGSDARLKCQSLREIELIHSLVVEIRTFSSEIPKFHCVTQHFF